MRKKKASLDFEIFISRGCTEFCVNGAGISPWATDLELIERTFPEGVGSIEMLCVYEVFDGQILRATFATGEKRLYAGPSIAS